MHELSITQHILDIVTKHAQRANAERVKAINLVVGDLTGFVDDSIQFYFDMLSPNTLAEGARLNIRRTPVKMRCRTCGAEYVPQDLSWLCPRCKASGGEIISGREFLVDSIEVQ
jgi:hydrogenase nickel incorporation protein HypA/HybF